MDAFELLKSRVEQLEKRVMECERRIDIYLDNTIVNVCMWMEITEKLWPENEGAFFEILGLALNRKRETDRKHFEEFLGGAGGFHIEGS